MIDFLIIINNRNKGAQFDYQFIKSPLNCNRISFGFNNLILWGDPIFPKNQINNEIAGWDIKKILNSIKGHFYFIRINSETKSISAGVSMFNILPLYYYKNEYEILISSDTQLLASQISIATINKRFILENILFNYQLFNHTCFNDIFLLNANHFLFVNNNKIEIKKHTAIEDLFVSSPIPWRKSGGILSDQFIELSNYYFPDEPFAISLTGGFDGRTLVSCGLHFKKNFSTYSFGTNESEDVKIARNLSINASLFFQNIELDNQYIQNESLINGREFVIGANGAAGFARAHYLYAIKQLAKKNNIIITGNFGSEVFRAAHIAGIVISPNLYNLFVAKDYSEAIELISSSAEFDWLIRENFKIEWEELKEDIRTLACFNPSLKELTKNEQFYKIVFDEILRKYFGAEMVNQYKYCINRTPYLDFDFIKSILETEMAGVYSDFFTHNPFKRFKGQVLYAHIIKKSYPFFSMEMTDKGYRPNDLLTKTGNLRIGISFAKKRMAKKILSDKDPYSVDAAFKFNKNYWHNLEIDPEIFCNNRFSASFHNPIYSKHSFYIALSQALWFNYLKGKQK